MKHNFMKRILAVVLAILFVTEFTPANRGTGRLFNSTVFAENVVEGSETIDTNHVHDWDTTYQWLPVGNGYICIATCICKYCASRNADIAIARSEPVFSSCVDDVEQVFVADFANEDFVSQRKVITLAPTGHKFVPEWAWKCDNNSNTYEACVAITCSECGERHISDWVETESEIIGRPDCNYRETVYTATCTLDGQDFTDKRIDIAAPAGHKYVPEWEWEWDNHSNTYVAHVAITCSECGERHRSDWIETEPEIISEPTCTKYGETVYTATCTLDGQDFTDKRIMMTPLVSHKYTAEWRSRDSRNKRSSVTLTCSECGAVHKSGIIENEPEIISEPTCASEGTMAYTATYTFEGQVYSYTWDSTISRTRHTYGEPVYENCNSGSYDAVRYCSVCGEELSRNTITIPEEERIDITNANLKINPITYGYDGNEHTVSGVLMLGNTELLEGRDYIVSGNTATEKGIYTFTAEGVGQYKGTVHATWRICDIFSVSANINGVTTTNSYEEKSLVKLTSSGTGGWFVNGVLTSTKNNLSFTVLGDTNVEWREGEFAQDGVVNCVLSDRKPNGEYTTVLATSTWAIPDDALILAAGTSRCYVDVSAETQDKQTVFETGKKYNSSLTKTNGTFQFDVNMGAENGAKKLCMVAYVTYQLGDETVTVISDVATSMNE